jgi:RNA polymerase sigma factor (sigma-70 family)
LALPNTNPNDGAKRVDRAVAVFIEYGDFVRAVIRYHVKNEAQADDLFQDFFLSLVSKPPPVDTQNMKSYLYRVICNDVVDAARRAKKYQARMERYAEYRKYSTIKDDIENTLIRTEEMNKIFKLIETRLRRSRAQAIVLRYMNHYKIQEIAERMNVNSGTARRYISVGLRKIRQFLTAE